MLMTHSIVLHLRPGVQSIGVQYQVANSGIWITWNEGDRVIQGATVRFTVTVYPNFVLTDWKAWYADEYDDTVSLSLSPVAGQSAWEFTMPPAGPVEIRCEAESRVSPESEWGINVAQPLEIVEVMDVDEFHSYMYPSTLPPAGDNPEAIPYRVVVSPGTAKTNFDSLYNQYVAGSKTAYFRLNNAGYLQLIYVNETDPEVSVPFMIDNSDPQYARRYHIEAFYVACNHTVDRSNRTMTITALSTGRVEYSHLWQNSAPAVINGAYYRTSVDSYYFSAAKARTITGSGSESSIRYIINPDNAGEVESDAPTEFAQGTTDFTFRWRIKVGYSLRRITPFAVGDGPLEDDVLYSSVYDGETRTYTVTVQQIPSWAIGVRVVIECTNLNDPNVGGNSDVGGGDGTFDETSDHIPIEPMPSISAADAGMITIFRPSLSELKELGAYLWTNIEDFIINLQKMFSNPMDTVIALNILPGIPPVGTPRTIRLGLWETNISMPPVLSQWYEIDFGAVRVSEFWGSALDYSPNTKIHAMLPFIGSVQLNTDDIMGNIVGLVYRIDLLSGHLVAMLTVNDEVLYQFTGECAVAVPLTGSDWSRVYGAIAGTIGAVAIGATGAAAAGATSAGLSQTASAAQHVATQADFDYMSAAISGASQSRLRALDSSVRQLNAAAMNAVGRRNAAEAAKVAGAVALGSNTVNQIMGAKFQIAHSGTISGSAGLLGVRRPYIYIEYPNQSLPENYKHFYGYPSNMYANLGSLSGFTQCYQVLLTGVNGTDGEIAEILELLKEGVYL